MRTVILKNGAEELGSFVEVMLRALSQLMTREPIAFYELVCLCRDSSHEVWPGMVEVLERAHLLKSGRVHDSIRNVVLSAVTGDEADMALGDPRAEPEASHV